jgi:hypothetical protein
MKSEELKEVLVETQETVGKLKKRFTPRRRDAKSCSLFAIIMHSSCLFLENSEQSEEKEAKRMIIQFKLSVFLRDLCVFA